MHKLAIVIPFYKIDYFEEALKSLRLQTNQNFNLYIGNDASPNDPLPLLEKYFKDHAYRYFNYEENLGKRNLAFQWARILENVDEEWFQILGDDDFFSPNFVEEFYKNVGSIDPSINVIKAKSVMCDGDAQVLKSLHEGFTTGLYRSADLMIKKIGGRLNSSLSEHVFRRSKYSEIGFPHYDLAWHTDDMLILKASDLGKILFVAETIVYVRVYEGSTSGSKANIDIKKKASLIFYNDFSRLLINRNVPLLEIRRYLKSLRNNKESIDVESFKKIHFNHGIFGQSYYLTYVIKMFLKRFVPTTFLKKLQGTDI